MTLRMIVSMLGGLALVICLGLLLHFAFAAEAPAAVAGNEALDGGFTQLNLKPIVNMDWRDEVAGDGKGGWTDQGDTDMRGVTTGVRQCAGVPFRLLDGAQNNDKAVLTLKSQKFMAGPASATLTVNSKAASIYFLHAAAWSGGQMAVYRVTYTDGAQIEIPIRDKEELEDWWAPKDGAHYRVGFTQKTAHADASGMLVYGWNNPQPEKIIASLTFTSTMHDGIVILAGVTLSDKPVSLPSPPLNPPDAAYKVKFHDGIIKEALAGPMQDVQDIVFDTCDGRGGPWYSTYGYTVVGGSGGPTTLDEYTNGRVLGKGNGRVDLNCNPKYGRLCKLNLRTRALTILLDEPQGGIRDPFVSYDGQRILFSRWKAGETRWHLWEINADGMGLRQLTNDDEDDIEPIYLANGDIIFSSTRMHRTVPCAWTQVAMLHRCDKDGKHIHPISAGIEVNRHPWPLPDGRIMFTRWEYTHRQVNAFMQLFTMNPDGTDQRVLFGNVADQDRYPYIEDCHFPEAKPIPGTNKVVACYCAEHHSEDGAGYPCTIDLAKGADDWSSMRMFADYDPAITYPGPADIDNHERCRRLLQATWGVSGSTSMCRDPYPFSENCFLMAHINQLLVMNGKGASEALYIDDRGVNVTVNEPRPIMARPVPPLMPAAVDYAKTTGTFALMNAYQGRDMAGVPPGEIARLLILEETPRPISGDGTYPGGYGLSDMNLLRTLGTVPVEADGSAYFEAPAMRSLVFVLQDKQDRPIKFMRSWAAVMPGERISCLGCHEARAQAPPAMGTRLALHRAPSLIAPVAGVPGIIDFPRDIQPILNKYCLRCHNPTQRAANFDLSDHAGISFTHGYSELRERGWLVNWTYGRGREQPYIVGSGVQKLLKLLDDGHHGVQLTASERTMLRSWMDAGQNYAGVYASMRNGRLNDQGLLNTLFAKEQGVFARRCDQCHYHAPPRKGMDPWPIKNDETYPVPFTRDALFDLTAPAQSLLLLAPLSRAAGGLGLCRQADAGSKTGTRAPLDAPIATVFASTADPDYQALLAMVQTMGAWQTRNPRYYQPGFKPTPEYVRHMQMYGILPADFQPGLTPFDPFAVEDRYYQSLWDKIKPTE